MAVLTTQLAADEPPPATVAGPLAWLRRNLFSGVWNSLLTIAVAAFLLLLIPPLFTWGVTNATFGHVTNDVCRANPGGACWAVVVEKWRLILFGRFPFDEQWRPACGILVLLAIVVASAQRRFWNRWLIVAWGVALFLFFWLMGGGLGLSTVRTNQWGGLPLTLLLSVIGIAVAFPIAILLALGRRSNLPVIKAICIVYIELIRGVPLVSLLFMASFMLPLFMPTGVSINEVLRAQVAIIMFTSAYLAEVIRGGLQAIPKGQTEAAQAIGLSFWQTQRKIILPQAIRLVIPPIVNTFIGLFKDTALVSIVGLSDLYLSMRQAIADPNWRGFYIEAYVFVALIYFFFCFSMSKYSQRLERSFRTGHKR